SQGEDGVLRHQGRLCVSDMGATKMYRDLREIYWWNGMKRDIAKFVGRCSNCQQVKAEHQGPGVDRFTKSAHFLPVRASYSAEDYAKLYIKEIVKLHGAPLSIISDRGAQFTSHFWRSFQSGLGTQVKLSTAFHPQTSQKSYADNRKRDLKFKVGDWVYFKISPMKRVVSFGKKGKLSPRYVGLYEILKRVGKVAYEFKLPNELASVHPVFHISMLKKCIGEPVSILPLEGLGVDENLSYEEVPVEILDRQVKNLTNKEVASVKVLWRNHLVEGATWEAEADMKSRYPHIFPSNS
ncbi:hypothetical protein MTR67_038905, partial [Solanum verrucosum]